MEKLDLVVKIGSMALIQKDENAIDYNIFQRLGGDLRPWNVVICRLVEVYNSYFVPCIVREREL